MRVSVEFRDRHFLLLVGLLAVVSAIGIVTGQTGPDPGHDPSEIGAGTFDSGDYVFPGNLGVGGNLDVTGKIIATNIGSVFVHWGNGQAPTGTTLIYSGHAFNSRYYQTTDSSGGANTLCIKDGDPATTGPGTNYGDLMYPVGTGNGMPTGIGNLKEVKCAVCYAEGPILEMWGTQTCPSGWETAYRGYVLAGYYYSHHSSDRYCVDSDNFDDSMTSNTHGELWYSSSVWDNTDLGGAYSSYLNKHLKCAVCVKD